MGLGDTHDLVSLAMTACAMDTISYVPSSPCMDPLL